MHHIIKFEIFTQACYMTFTILTLTSAVGSNKTTARVASQHIIRMHHRCPLQLAFHSSLQQAVSFMRFTSFMQFTSSHTNAFCDTLGQINTSYMLHSRTEIIDIVRLRIPARWALSARIWSPPSWHTSASGPANSTNQRSSERQHNQQMADQVARQSFLAVIFCLLGALP